MFIETGTHGRTKLSSKVSMTNTYSLHHLIDPGGKNLDVGNIPPIFSLSNGGGADQGWATLDPRRGGSSRKTPIILGPDQQFPNLSATCLSPINYATTKLLQQPVYHIPPLTLTTIFLPLLLKPTLTTWYIQKSTPHFGFSLYSVNFIET